MRPYAPPTRNLWNEPHRSFAPCYPTSLHLLDNLYTWINVHSYQPPLTAPALDALPPSTWTPASLSAPEALRHMYVPSASYPFCSLTYLRPQRCNCPCRTLQFLPSWLCPSTAIEATKFPPLPSSTCGPVPDGLKEIRVSSLWYPVLLPFVLPPHPLLLRPIFWCLPVVCTHSWRPFVRWKEARAPTLPGDFPPQTFPCATRSQRRRSGCAPPPPHPLSSWYNYHQLILLGCSVRTQQICFLSLL